MCRIYLWHNPNDDIMGLNRALHPVHPILNDNGPYYPQNINFYDYAFALLMCMHVYLSIDNLRREYNVYYL